MRHVAVPGAPSSIGLRPHDETVAETASTVLDRVAASDVSGFRIHADADVLLAHSLLGGGRHAAPA